MKQVFLIVLVTLTVILLIIFGYRFLPLLSGFNIYGSYQLTFNPNFTHSDLYAPDSLAFKLVNKDEAAISWKFAKKELLVPPGIAPEYAVLSGYRIYKDGFWHKDIPASQPGFTDSELYPNEKYSYSVSALTFDNKIEGEKSVPIEIKTGDFALTPIEFPIRDVKRYLAEGDSITAAENVGPGLGYADLVTTYFNQNGFNITLYNKGVTGSTSGTVDDRIAAEIQEIDPDLVTIAIGVNDIFTRNEEPSNESISTYADHLKSIIRKANIGRKRDVVLLNIFYINCCSEKHKVWDREVRDIANKYGVLYIDVSNPMIGKGGKDLLAGDLHPNADGQRIIAGAVYDSLNKYLNK